MKHILFPTDFSQNSKNAIAHGLSLFGQGSTSFTLLNTFHIPFTGHDVMAAVGNVTSEKVNESFSQLTSQIAEDFSEHKFEFETVFHESDVATGVAHIVKRGDVDLVVMGTQGSSGLAKVLVGTNTLSVVKQAVCPILIVPEHSEFRKPKRIVLAHDGSNRLTKRGLQPLMQIVDKFNTEILILHVHDEHYEPWGESDVFDFEWDAKMSHHEVLSHNVPNAIEEFVAANGADMLVLAAHKLNLFERIFHKSVTKRLALHANIPILVIYD